jgi:cell division transport system permease protein
MVRRSSGVFVLSVSMAALGLAIPALVAALTASAWPVFARLNLAPEATVFAKTGASPNDLQKLQNTLEQTPGVDSVRLVTRDAALAELSERAGLQGPIAQLSANPLPDALIVRFRNGAGLDEVESAVSGFGTLAGVDSVQADVRWYRKLLAVARAVLWTSGGLAAAAVLLVVLVLIGAVRLLAATSADEFRALRLVGAGRQFLVRPFVYLGAAAMLLAAVLAGAGVWVAMQALQHPAQDLAAAYGASLSLLVPSWPWWVGGLAAAALLGGVVASLAARGALRHIRD